MANPLLDSWAHKEGALHLEPDEPRERAPRRRRLAFWALCICFACHTVWAHCQFRLTDPMIHWAFVPPRLDGLAPEDGKPYSCYYSYGRHPSSDTRSYTTHFTLPRHAPEHYMFSYSTHVGGAVNFTTHPAAEGAVEDRVQVRVTVESLKNDCPVNICEMHTGGYRPNSTWGVGVFDYSTFPNGTQVGSDCKAHAQHAALHATFSFPVPPGSPQPMLFRSLRTRLLAVAQNVDLGPALLFERAFVFSENATIAIKSINIVQGWFSTYTRTLDGPISATATVSQSLQIYTVGAPITANITLVGSQADNTERKLDIHGWGGAVDATILLDGPGAENRRMQYRVFTVNAGPTRLRLPSIPANTNVAVDAFNFKGGGTEITLDSAFEGAHRASTSLAGDFELRTVAGKPVVNVRPGAQDPERRRPARNRTVEIDETEEGVLGETFWGERRSTLGGSVWVGSAMEPNWGEIVLNL